MTHLEEAWPQMDRDLPVLRRAKTLRATLSMPPMPPFSPPKAKQEFLPIASDIRVCSSQENQCPAGQQAWCDVPGVFIDCCPVGLTPGQDAANCQCSPGGSSYPGSCPKGDLENFRKIVTDRIGELHEPILTCYRRAFLAEGPIEGRLIVEFEIGPTGRVLPLGPNNSVLYASPVQTCIHQVLSQAKFAPPVDGHTTVSIPLKFEK